MDIKVPVVMNGDLNMNNMIRKNKTYLITGATGFLGTELCKRIYPTGCGIVAMSRNEGKLVELKQQFPDIKIITGDVADKIAVEHALAWGIDGIFHLAAFKHVGMAEDQARECVLSNTVGSLNLLEVTNGRMFDFIIGISTDKAAQIAGVYGATKMLMERLFQEFEKKNVHTKYRIVRYGNVLYSTGSVLCKWKDAMINEKDIVVTATGATRFFWTVEQAIDLIFDCLENAEDATPYVPEMKAMKVGDLLTAMTMKYGKAKSIKIIGLQKGENLHEKILENGKYSNEVDLYGINEIMTMI